MAANDDNMKWLGFGATNLSHATKIIGSRLAKKSDNTQLFYIMCQRQLFMEILGKDSSNQEIIPIKDKLELKTNRHPNIDGTAWGWITGCSKNIVWSNDTSKFNREKAEKLVRDYNYR